MSKALKCNKCEACFDPENTDGYFVSFDKIVIRNASTYKETKTAFVDPSFDLCPRCSAEFLDWARIGDRLKKTVEREEAKRAEQEKIDKMLESMPENKTSNDLLKKMRGIANSLWREAPNKKEE